jgi:hypothetical protein
MPDQKKMIRIMGETDIVDIEMTNGQLSHPLLMGLDLADRVNLLGHWMDQDRGAALAADSAHLAAMGMIASDIVQADTHAAAITAGANFALVTILREKWPVGSKAKFKRVAARVKADHTYLAHVCAAMTLDNLDNAETLKQAETSQLSLALAYFKANRRRFANSSAVQGLIRS